MPKHSKKRHAKHKKKGTRLLFRYGTKTAKKSRRVAKRNFLKITTKAEAEKVAKALDSFLRTNGN